MNLEYDWLALALIFAFWVITTLLWYIFVARKHHYSLGGTLSAFFLGCTSTIPVLYFELAEGLESNLIFFKITAIPDYKENIISLFGFSSYQEVISSIQSDYFYIWILALFGTYIWVGISEEIAKHMVINPYFRKTLQIIAIASIIWITATSNDSFMTVMIILSFLILLYITPKYLKFRSINDIVFVSIIAALGFTFFENILYSYQYYWDIASRLGTHSILEFWDKDIIDLLEYSFVRATQCVLVHTFCSCIFGYHFALSYFANDIKSTSSLMNFLSNIFQENKIVTYRNIQFLAWIFLSVIVHWIYDVASSLNLEIHNIAILGYLIPIYFIWGIIYILLTLENPKNQIRHRSTTL